MPDIEQDLSEAEDSRTESDLCADLSVIAKMKLSGSDAETIHAAIQRLEFLSRITEGMYLLQFELAQIDTMHELDEANDPHEKGKIELARTLRLLPRQLPGR